MATRQVIPTGQWVDPDGVFLKDAVITIASNGTGTANVGSEAKDLHILPVYDEYGRMVPDQFELDVGGSTAMGSNIFTILDTDGSDGAHRVLQGSVVDVDANTRVPASGGVQCTLTSLHNHQHEKHRLALTPVGKWIDASGGFLCGEVLTFKKDGTGDVTLDEPMPLDIQCVLDGNGVPSPVQFCIGITGDDDGNIFVRKGDQLHGTYVTHTWCPPCLAARGELNSGVWLCFACPRAVACKHVHKPLVSGGDQKLACTRQHGQLIAMRC